MKRAAAIVLIAELCLALTASAKTFEWRLTSPQAHAETFTAYHGETVRFNPVWSGALSNVTSSVLYYQTNGMDRTWWQADGLTFAPSNDVGAASYRFFIRATDPEGVNYTANGLLRLMESPGFVPNTITPPVAALDFDNIDVWNAPYYTKDETDAKIVELSPPADLSDYATTQSLMAEVSSASQSATNYTDTVAASLGALAWVDSVDWADILGKPSWIGATKPTYSLNDVCPDSENWLGVQGNAGRIIKILAQGSGSSPAGGVQVTASTLNNNNTTTYAYSGVAVKRNGVNTDYLWDSTSSSGIVRRSELDDKADASVVTTLANKVDAIETWAIGDETALVIHDAGQTNATLTVTYTNNVMYSSAVAESNTLAKARAQTDSAIVTALEVVGTALDAKAPKAWGTLTSGGAPAPDDTLVIEKKKVAITGGGNYASIESSTGCYYVLAVSLGSEWTLESLADAQNPTNAATVTFSDSDGNGVYQIVSTASRTVDAIAGVDMLAPSVRVESGNDVVTMNFPVVAAEPPTMYYKPNLTNEFAEASSSNWPGVVSSVVWSGSSGLYTATVTMVGRPGSGFFCAKYIKPGSVYVRYMKPICVPSITLDDVTYTISVETINDKKLMVLTEVN